MRRYDFWNDGYHAKKNNRKRGETFKIFRVVLSEKHIKLGSSVHFVKWQKP